VLYVCPTAHFNNEDLLILPTLYSFFVIRLLKQVATIFPYSNKRSLFVMENECLLWWENWIFKCLLHEIQM
jgi:hypothetical protein